MIRRLLKTTAILLAFVISFFAVGLLVLTIAEYRPANTENTISDGIASEQLNVGDTVRGMSWNLGCGTLGDNAGFH